MSSFVNPVQKYPLGATPRTTRSSAQLPTATKDSAISSPVKPRQVQEKNTRRSQTRRATRSRAQNVEEEDRSVRDQPDLAPVGEGNEDEGSENVTSDVSSNAVNQQLNDELEYEGHSHDVSGPTLFENESDAENVSDPEAGGLDAISMAESLPSLQVAADSLLKFFASSFSTPSSIAELARQLANPKSSQSKRLHYLNNNFALQREHFGPEVYIPVRRIAAILPAVEVSSKTWRVDGIIYKSNCAQLALEILTKIQMRDDAQQSLFELEGQFPLPFLTALRGSVIDDAGQSGLRRQTFNLALDARTQFLKTNLIEIDQKSQDPRAILEGVFYNENLDSQLAANTSPSLRGFNLPGFFQDENGNLPEQYVDDIQERIREINSCFMDNGEVDFDALEERFSWEEFLFLVAKWLRSRNEELNQHLEQQPSVIDIHDELEDAINRANPEDAEETQNGGAAPTSQEDRSNQQRRLLPPAEIMEKPETNVRQSFGGMKDLMALARFGKQLNSGNGPEFAPRLSQLASHSTGRTGPVTPTSRQQPGLDTGEFDGLGHQQRSTLDPSRRAMPTNQRLSLPSQGAMHGTPNQLARERHHATFIDRQANASRVSPIDSQRLGSGGVGPSRKRGRDVSYDDEDEDGEFERDNRHIDVQSRRGQKPAQTAKRARYDGIGHDEAREAADGRRHETLNALVSRDEIRAVEHPADQTMAPLMPRPAPPKNLRKLPQTRRPWTREEDDQFMRLIKEHGISWAEIKSQDENSEEPKLRNRDQGNLKDRARNLKMILLKGGTLFEQLPENFDRIPLKRADIDNLRQRGIHIPDPIQRRPTNLF